VDKASIGLNLRDVSDLSIAATDRDMAISFAVAGDLDCDHDGCYVQREMRGFTVVGDVSTTIRPLPNAGVGITPLEDATPLVLDGEVSFLTQGHAGAAALKNPGEDDADTIYVVRRGKILHKTGSRFSGTFAALGLGHDGIAIGTGVEPTPGGPPEHRGVRVLRFAADRDVTSTVVVREVAPWGESTTPWYDTPAISAAGGRVAIAFRAHRPPHTSLSVAWVDPHTGKVTSKPALVATGDVGAPALLVDEERLHVVWSERANAKAPYRLRHAQWLHGADAPAAASDLRTPTESAIAPAIAKLGTHFALAWMHGDLSGRGVVHAGFGASLGDAAASATQHSSHDVTNARDPEWGGAAHRVVLVWTEHDGPRRIRYTTCQ
jgi:hypothetical protein